MRSQFLLRYLRLGQTCSAFSVPLIYITLSFGMTNLVTQTQMLIQTLRFFALHFPR